MKLRSHLCSFQSEQEKLRWQKVIKLFLKMRFLASLLDFVYSCHSRFPSKTEFRMMLLYILYESVVHCYMCICGVTYLDFKLRSMISNYETEFEKEHDQDKKKIVQILECMNLNYFPGKGDVFGDIFWKETTLAHACANVTADIL